MQLCCFRCTGYPWQLKLCCWQQLGKHEMLLVDTTDLLSDTIPRSILHWVSFWLKLFISEFLIINFCRGVIGEQSQCCISNPTTQQACCDIVVEKYYFLRFILTLYAQNELGFSNSSTTKINPSLHGNWNTCIIK